MLLVGGDATRAPGLAAGARIAEATGARWLCETFPTRLERGAGVPAVERLAYFAEAAAAQLDGVKHLVLAGAKSPVSFFAYPGMPSDLVPAGCDVHVLAEHSGAAEALARTRRRSGARHDRRGRGASRPELPTGDLTSASVADVIGALLPERAIVVDESNTAGLRRRRSDRRRPGTRLVDADRRRDRLRAYPAAVGAAIAAPDRPVLSPAGRRLGDVHDLGAVDAGPREPRRHYGHLQQRCLRHPADRAAACRRTVRLQVPRR